MIVTEHITPKNCTILSDWGSDGPILVLEIGDSEISLEFSNEDTMLIFGAAVADLCKNPSDRARIQLSKARTI